MQNPVFGGVKHITIGICPGCNEMRHSEWCIDCDRHVKRRRFIEELPVIDDTIGVYEGINELIKALALVDMCNPEYAFKMLTMLTDLKLYREEQYGPR